MPRALFTEGDAAAFMRPISGDGGGQRFVRACQAKMCGYPPTSGCYIPLAEEEFEKWIRYRDAYGRGGFQSRLKLGKLDAGL